MRKSIFFSSSYTASFLFRPQFRRLRYTVSALEYVELHVYFIIIIKLAKQAKVS